MGSKWAGARIACIAALAGATLVLVIVAQQGHPTSLLAAPKTFGASAVGWSNPLGHNSKTPVMPRNIFKQKQGRMQMLSDSNSLPAGVPAGLHPGEGPAPSYLSAKAWARGEIKPAGLAPGGWSTSWRAVKDEDRHLRVKSVKSSTPDMPSNLF